MRSVIAIDPSVTNTGVAVYEDAELAFAFQVKCRGWAEAGMDVSIALADRYPLEALAQVLAIEIPQVYHQRKQKGRQEDVVKVALAAGSIAGALCEFVGEVVTYLPNQWKGQVPKEVMVRRVKKRLSHDELDRVELPSAASEEHNVYDAVGIGLRYLRRI